MKTYGTNNWVYPRRDQEGQWWWDGEPVFVVVLPESDKLEYLKSMGILPKSSPDTPEN